MIRAAKNAPRISSSTSSDCLIGFAKGNSIGVTWTAIPSKRLVGNFRDVRASHDHLNTSGANSIGYAIGLGDHTSHCTDADQADIFINASRLDNMPVSVLEAFASGTPVVTTAPEGMRYLVEHERTGMLSEPGDAEALARNVIRLLQEPELACQLASNAHEQLSRYCWGAVREQWLDVYHSLNRDGAIGDHAPLAEHRVRS